MPSRYERYLNKLTNNLIEASEILEKISVVPCPKVLDMDFYTSKIKLGRERFEKAYRKWRRVCQLK